MSLFFLEAAVPLTKSFTKKNSELTKTPYPFVWEFTSHKETCLSLAHLEVLLRKHATLGHCMLKGTIARDLVKESRAGSTDTNAATNLIVLDLDGLPEMMPDSSITLTVDLFLEAIGLKDISYLLQWSASYGIENKKLRAHIFMMLDKPTAAPLLKQWLIHLNHATPLLREAMSLTKTGNAIRWPLDISACQNDKLIYIAPPLLKGLPDPLAKVRRIELVKRKADFLSIAHKFSAEKNRELTVKRLNELREAEGLPKRKHVTKMHGSTEVLLKPDVCTITEMKQERGFVYFNLNGGDSWAYYHPENNPEFILNFKGEPSYLTKELLPDYWSELTSKSVRTGSDGITYLAFCDAKTAAYWYGTYTEATDCLDLNLAKTGTQVRDYAKQVGMPLGDFIPVWDMTFDPQDNVRVDLVNKTINTFTPSDYMKAVAKKVTTPPKTIMKVLSHALGGDRHIVEHFINWCAYILQCRDRTTTAWVLHGRTGTGKGILMNNVLRPIFGMAHTTSRRMEELNEPYNHFMKSCFLVFVDEVQTKALQNERGVMAKLKNFITEKMVAIRAMYQNGHEARNYTNWIFASNMSDPVLIEKNDRRFNVGKYQTQQLIITDKEIEQIEKELQTFHDYLLYYPLDKAKATTVIDTADRTTMMSISESSIDTVSDKLLAGDFEFFMDQLPAGTSYLTGLDATLKLDNYKSTLITLINRATAAAVAPPPSTRTCSIAREELRVIYDFVIGNVPNTPNKFTSLLKHHRVHIEKVWLDGRTVSGIKVNWQDQSQFSAYLAALTPKVKKPSTVVPISAGKKMARATI
jgi:hypothetical protein